MKKSNFQVKKPFVVFLDSDFDVFVRFYLSYLQGYLYPFQIT